MCLLIGTGSQVSDVAHGLLVGVSTGYSTPKYTMTTYLSSKNLTTTCIHYIRNIIPDVCISFCELYTFHETACILEKNGVEYILSRVTNVKNLTQLSIYSVVLVAVI